MEVCQIELIAIFHKSRRHQRVFVTSEYTSSTTTTTTSRHLLQTHRCTKRVQWIHAGWLTLAWLWWLLPQWKRDARLMEQPLPQCWSTN